MACFTGCLSWPVCFSAFSTGQAVVEAKHNKASESHHFRFMLFIAILPSNNVQVGSPVGSVDTGSGYAMIRATYGILSVISVTQASD